MPASPRTDKKGQRQGPRGATTNDANLLHDIAQGRVIGNQADRSIDRRANPACSGLLSTLAPFDRSAACAVCVCTFARASLSRAAFWTSVRFSVRQR